MNFDKDASRTDADSKAIVAAEEWVKPEIASFKPVAAAEGNSYNPGDGVSNLS